MMNKSELLRIEVLWKYCCKNGIENCGSLVEAEGHLILFSYSTSAEYSLELQSIKGDIIGSFDIEQVMFSPIARTICLLTNNDKSSIIRCIVADPFDYVVFCNAARECERVADMNLRMKIVLRDIYFRGFYEATEKEEPDGTITNTIRELLNDDNGAIDNIPLKKFKHSEIETHKCVNISSVADGNTCFLCQLYGPVPGKKKCEIIIEHPSMPIRCNRLKLFIGLECFSVWMEHRHKAEFEETLVDETDGKEEICCICSCRPDQVIVCDLCPRSFCHVCLESLLGAKQCKFMRRSKDWICPCCKYMTRNRTTIESSSSTSTSLSLSLSWPCLRSYTAEDGRRCCSRSCTSPAPPPTNPNKIIIPSTSSNSTKEKKLKVNDTTLKIIYSRDSSNDYLKGVMIPLLIHPSIPILPDGSTAYVCQICYCKWIELRHIYLESEKNRQQKEQSNDSSPIIVQNLPYSHSSSEEVCCVCSAEPDLKYLTACCNCPRSFCTECMRHMFTESEREVIKSAPELWSCMACRHVGIP